MIRLFVLIFVFCFGSVCFSQTEPYQFMHLSTDNGLSQSSVISINQDNLGQIWIGTRDGLNKYDGKEFTIYRTEVDNPESISNNDILTIEQDKDGFIWIGTYNGLNKYNPRTNTFTRYFHSQETSSLSNNTVSTIKVMSNGQVWIGTLNGLSIYNKSTDSFINFRKSNTENSIIGNSILSILETKGGFVFIGTNNGLSQLIDSKEYTLKFGSVLGTEGLNVQDLIETPTKQILMATQEKNVLVYDLDTKNVSSYFPEESLIGMNKNARQLLFDDAGQLWIGTYNGIQIANKDKSITVLNSNIIDPKSLSKNSVKSLFKDKKGSIWIGTYYGGINIWDASNINFVNIKQIPGKSGLSYDVVSSIASYKNLIFFGTEGGGVTVLNKTNNLYSYINKKNEPGLPNNNIKSLFISNDSKLWIGAFNGGLAIYNVDSHKFETTFLPESLKNYLNNVGVYAIKQDKSKNIWLGTFGKGLVKYNLEDKVFETYISNENSKNALSSNMIRSLEIDANQNVWVGTEKGLNKVDVKGKITNYFYDNNLQSGDDILSIFKDSKNDIWVGVKAKGLFKLHDLDFDAVDLLINGKKISAVHSILEDDSRNLWISTNQGLVKYHIDTQQSTVFNQKDGLVSNEFNDSASIRINETQFYFGGPEGVTYFDSKKLNTNKYAPQVIITDFKIKNQSVGINDENSVLKETISFTEAIELAYDQGNFSVSFAIPNFINSNNNRYQYRLKGLENEWITTSTSTNTASYTIQNPGNYVFEVKGANSDSEWNATSTNLKIRVTPAPWRSWWAFTLYALAILIVLFLLMNILKSKTKLKHQLDLEHIETERAKEINNAKLEFFTNISHEFRTPLALILGPMHQIIEDYKGSSKIYKKLLVVENSANHLLQLINRLMDFRKLENNLFKLEAAEGNIVKFLKEIYLSFGEFAKDGGYEYVFQTTDDEILVYYDRYKLERVFYNLISNAFRYTPKNGKIAIAVKQEFGNIIIQVQDSGVGVAKEYQDKIFERFFEVSVNNKPDNDYNKGTGIGLSIAKNIVNLHKGQISVCNNDGQGSVFTVTLPLGRIHLNDEEIIKDFKFSDDVSQYIKQLDEPFIVTENDALEQIASEDKPTVLLVEDNKPLRKFMRSILKETYNILEAENGKIAFEIAKKEFPDLIISDVVMPKMAGTELCSVIKQDLRTSHIPIILLTSRTSLVYKLEGLESGADDYISKPFDVNEFKLRIKNLLDSNLRLKEKFTSSDLLQPNEVMVSSFDEKLYKKALQIVEENIGNEQFDIPYFSSELGVSRTMLFTKIKAWSNFTPNDFIQHIRMRRAAQLLEQGKINVAEVSYKVGFKNPKYFSKCFQKKFGKTPSQYADTFFET